MKKGHVRAARSVQKNALLNAIRKVCSIIFPIITFPYVTRVLQVENMGIYQFSYSNVSYFILIAGLGISTYAIREGPQYREDRQKISAFSSEVFSLNLVSTLCSYVLLGLCLLFVAKFRDYRTAMLLFSSEIFFTTIGMEWIYALNEDYFFITVRSVVFQVLSFVLLLVFVRSEAHLYRYIIISVIANAGANTINFFCAGRYVDLRINAESFKRWRAHIRPVMIIFASSVAITIYVSADVTMLGFLTDDYTVGLYTTATKVYTIFKNLISSLLVVTIPRFALLMGEDKKSELEDAFRRVFGLLMCLILPAALGLIFLSEEVTFLAGGSNYLPGSVDLMILGGAAIFSLFAFLYTQCILIPGRREMVVLVATAVSALSNIALNFLLIPHFLDRAAAFTTLVAEAITFFIAYFASRRQVRIRGMWKDALSVAAGCVLVAAVCLLGRALIPNMLLRLCAVIPLSVIFYGLVLLVMRNSSAVKLLGAVKGRRGTRE